MASLVDKIAIAIADSMYLRRDMTRPEWMFSPERLQCLKIVRIALLAMRTTTDAHRQNYLALTGEELDPEKWGKAIDAALGDDEAPSKYG